MSKLSTYYYTATFLFVLNFVCDIIFYTKYSTCTLGNSKADFFMFLIIINILLIIFNGLVGYIVNLFHEMDPDEISNLGILKKLLGILARLLPRISKFLHIVKILIVIILGFFAFINAEVDMDYIDSSSSSNTTTTTINPDCYNKTEVQKKYIDSYPNQIKIFSGIEILSIILVSCGMGMYKSTMNIEGYFYEPVNRNDGAAKKLIFKNLGP